MLLESLVLEQVLSPLLGKTSYYHMLKSIHLRLSYSILPVSAAVYGQIALVMTSGAAIGAYISKRMAITGTVQLSLVQ